jgi:hypothetical protein
MHDAHIANNLCQFPDKGKKKRCKKVAPQSESGASVAEVEELAGGTESDRVSNLMFFI